MSTRYNWSDEPSLEASGEEDNARLAADPPKTGESPCRAPSLVSIPVTAGRAQVRVISHVTDDGFDWVGRWIVLEADRMARILPFSVVLILDAPSRPEVHRARLFTLERDGAWTTVAGTHGGNWQRLLKDKALAALQDVSGRRIEWRVSQQREEPAAGPDSEVEPSAGSTALPADVQASEGLVGYHFDFFDDRYELRSASRDEVSEVNEARERARTNAKRCDFVLDASPEQGARLEAWQHAQESLWREALKQRGSRSPSYEDREQQSEWVKNERAASPELRAVPRNLQDLLLSQLNTAAAQNRAPKPPDRDSLEWPLLQATRNLHALSHARIRFPKLNELHLVGSNSLQLPCQITRVCIARRDDVWHVAVYCVDEVNAGDA